jgi:hypothetical protein
MTHRQEFLSMPKSYLTEFLVHLILEDHAEIPLLRIEKVSPLIRIKNSSNPKELSASKREDHTL